MRSRFAILATFLVVALVFAGCVAPVAVPAESGGEAAAAGGEAASDAAPTELVVSTWGFNQDLIDKNLTRPFEEANNVKIVYETGNNAERLTKLAARGDSPQVDVVHFAGPFTFEASQQGLLQPHRSEHAQQLRRTVRLGQGSAGQRRGRLLRHLRLPDHLSHRQGRSAHHLVGRPLPGRPQGLCDGAGSGHHQRPRHHRHAGHGLRRRHRQHRAGLQDGCPRWPTNWSPPTAAVPS
ncbi:MAG: hypothetical protein R2851_16970 [Caldilineaceae bacterium]